jgi:hypothetical protein
MLYLERIEAAMSYLRTVSTRRLLAVCAAVVLAAGAVTAIALAAAGAGPKPPPKPLAEAVQDALDAPRIRGVKARISFTNRLVDAASLRGSDPLLAGATGRLWASGERLRLELQAAPDTGAGDVQVLVDGRRLSVYESGSRTAYRMLLPEDRRPSGPVPSLARVQQAITRLSRRATLSGAIPSTVAGRAAYTARGAPRSSGGLLGRAEVSWDAGNGAPLRAAVYARGASKPVLELKATDVSFGPVAASDLAPRLPAPARTMDFDPGSRPQGADRDGEVTGLAAVRRKVGFAVAAPRTLAGRARQEVRLVELKSSPAALVTYGEGPGSIAVLQSPVRAEDRGGVLGGPALPAISVNGIAGEELGTPLGTLVRFERAGVQYTVVGSVPRAAAEAAARGL